MPLRAWAPVGNDHKHVIEVNGTIVVEVCWTARTWAPVGNDHKHVIEVACAIVVEVAETCWWATWWYVDSEVADR